MMDRSSISSTHGCAPAMHVATAARSRFCAVPSRRFEGVSRRRRSGSAWMRASRSQRSSTCSTSCACSTSYPCPATRFSPNPPSPGWKRSAACPRSPGRPRRSTARTPTTWRARGSGIDVSSSKPRSCNTPDVLRGTTRDSSSRTCGSPPKRSTTSTVVEATRRTGSRRCKRCNPIGPVCARFLANQLRLTMTAAAYVLFQELRWRLRRTKAGRAQVGRLQIMLMKIGARVVASVRRFVLHFPSSHPWKDIWSSAARAVGAAPA